MLNAALHGAAAGAAGSTALNSATYLDMVLRARPTSDTPAQVVDRATKRAGYPVPGTGDDRTNRLEGLGALGGIGTGVAVGAAFGWLRSKGLRLNAVVGPVLVGAAAMLATDAAMARLGVSDPRDWSTADWVSDAIPHLVFGITTWSTLVAIDPA